MIGGSAGIGDEVAGDDAVDEDEDEHGREEEEANGADEVQLFPESVGLRQTAGPLRTAHHRLFVPHDEQHRTANSIFQNFKISN